MEKLTVSLTVNGEDVTLFCTAGESLMRMLRGAHYYDVKCGCEEGDCGSCTVLLDGVAVKSCFTLAAACQGHTVETCKGLSYQDALARDLQESFVRYGAVQCGFCTPGMVTAALSYLRRGGKADRSEIRGALSGNLCRCTGYKKIVDAVYETALKLERGAER